MTHWLDGIKWNTNPIITWNNQCKKRDLEDWWLVFRCIHPQLENEHTAWLNQPLLSPVSEEHSSYRAIYHRKATSHDVWSYAVTAGKCLEDHSAAYNEDRRSGTQPAEECLMIQACKSATIHPQGEAYLNSNKFFPYSALSFSPQALYICSPISQ